MNLFAAVVIFLSVIHISFTAPWQDFTELSGEQLPMFAPPWQETPRYSMMGYQVTTPWQTPMMFTADEPRQYIYLSAPNVQSHSPPLSQPMPSIQGYNPGNIVYPSRSYIASNQAYDQRNYYRNTHPYQQRGLYRHY